VTALDGNIAETPKMTNATAIRATSTMGRARFTEGTARTDSISGSPTLAGLRSYQDLIWLSDWT
jgi:hypothetical protein